MFLTADCMNFFRRFFTNRSTKINAIVSPIQVRLFSNQSPTAEIK